MELFFEKHGCQTESERLVGIWKWPQDIMKIEYYLLNRV